MLLLALQFVAFQPAVREILENHNTYFVFFIRKKRISCKMNDNTSCGYRRCDSVDLRRSLESVMEPKVAA